MDEASNYEYPKTCEFCGSENIGVRVIWHCGQVRVVCADCGESRALPKTENLQKRTNTPLSNWAIRTIKHEPWCHICGSRENLEAHHIIPVSHSIEYSYMDTNGLTLCQDCHRLVHHKAPSDTNSKQQRLVACK